jgi:hypothetical protein
MRVAILLHASLYSGKSSLLAFMLSTKFYPQRTLFSIPESTYIVPLASEEYHEATALAEEMMRPSGSHHE